MDPRVALQVTGVRGLGKSALVLEAARYLRFRNRFPHGIFCCSLEGLRSMKAVRTRLGQALHTANPNPNPNPKP